MIKYFLLKIYIPSFYYIIKHVVLQWEGWTHTFQNIIYNYIIILYTYKQYVHNHNAVKEPKWHIVHPFFPAFNLSSDSEGFIETGQNPGKDDRKLLEILEVETWEDGEGRMWGRLWSRQLQGCTLSFAAVPSNYFFSSL